MLLEISNSVKYLVIFILLFCRVLDSDGEEVELCSSVECKVDIFLPGYFFPLLYGCVSQGLGTTESMNLIG